MVRNVTDICIGGKRKRLKLVHSEFLEKKTLFISINISLNNFEPMFYFLPPQNIRKPVFFNFSGGIGMKHWLKKDQLSWYTWKEAVKSWCTKYLNKIQITVGILRIPSTNYCAYYCAEEEWRSIALIYPWKVVKLLSNQSASFSIPSLV